MVGRHHPVLGHYRRPFDNRQNIPLDTFAGNIRPGLTAFTDNFVDFVNVYNTPPCLFHIIIRILKQRKDNIFDIFTDVASFGNSGRVTYCKGYFQFICESAGKEGFT